MNSSGGAYVGGHITIYNFFNTETRIVSKCSKNIGKLAYPASVGVSSKQQLDYPVYAGAASEQHTSIFTHNILDNERNPNSGIGYAITDGVGEG